jgi:hypothetical protein
MGADRIGLRSGGWSELQLLRWAKDSASLRDA